MVFVEPIIQVYLQQIPVLLPNSVQRPIQKCCRFKPCIQVCEMYFVKLKQETFTTSSLIKLDRCM